MIKDLLENVCNGIYAANFTRIDEADANPDKWFELMVIYDNDSTETVAHGNTFAECFKDVNKYVGEYRFDRLNIDIWKNRESPENEDGLFCKVLIYKLIYDYLEEKDKLNRNNMHGSFRFDEQGKQTDFEKDYNGTGSIFKDEIAFSYFQDMICYISEHEDDDDFFFDKDEGDNQIGSTYQDILSICNEKTKNARSLFDNIKWEHPSTVYEQWEYNGILGEEEVDGKPAILVYTDEGDLVTCTWCDKKMIVPTGADKCPHCYYVGSLAWLEEKRGGIKLSDIEHATKYHLIYKGEPDMEEYLSDEVLRDEYGITPSSLYRAEVPETANQQSLLH